MSDVGEFLDSRARTPDREPGGRSGWGSLVGERGADLDGNEKTQNTSEQRSGAPPRVGPS